MVHTLDDITGLSRSYFTLPLAMFSMTAALPIEYSVCPDSSNSLPKSLW